MNTNKNKNTYTKIDDALLEEVGNLVEAFIISFVLREADYYGTTKPEIQKTYIMKRLPIGKKQLDSTLKQLQNEGWFTMRVTSRGAKTTLFSLSEKAIKYLPKKHVETQDATEQTTFEEPTISNSVTPIQTKQETPTQYDDNDNLPWDDDGVMSKTEMDKQRQQSRYAKFMMDYKPQPYPTDEETETSSVFAETIRLISKSA